MFGRNRGKPAEMLTGFEPRGQRNLSKLLNNRAMFPFHFKTDLLKELVREIEEKRK